jgi:type I restriction enzyme S subunit
VKYPDYPLMSKEKKNTMTPKLRFPEFREAKEWEEKSMEQISPSIFDGTHQTPTYTDIGIPFFSVENLVSGNKNKFISKEDKLSATNKNKPEKGDILITRIGKIGFSAIVDWEYEFSIYVTLAVIKKSDLFDSYYLHCYIQSDRYQKEIQSKSLLNAVPCKINMEELRKTKVLIPKKNEQQKIAATLSSLDDLIAAQSEKIKALQSHKKGLMQQLFPAEGEMVPRVRFKEFEGAGEWEESNLGENTIKVGSGITPRGGDKTYKKEGRPFVRSQNVGWGYLILENIAFIDETTHSTFSSTEIEPGDILLNITGASIGRCAIADTRIKGGNVNQHVCIIRPKKELSPLFLNQYLLSDNGQKQIDDFQAGGNRQGLNFAQIRSLSIPLPPKLDEQQKIATCLTSLDDLIAAQSEKLEALKAHKKGLMQQLFPNPSEA